MRRLNQILALILIVGLTLTTAHIISAQQQQRGGGQRRGGRQGGGPQMDPAAMRERMLERRIENVTQGMQELNIPENEAAVLKDQIGLLLRARMDHSNEMEQIREALQQALDAKDNAQIKAKLDAIKAIRKERRAKNEEMEKNLIEILPLKVEALLTVQQIVNSDGGGGMGFGGGRGPRREGVGPGGQRMPRRGGE